MAPRLIPAHPKFETATEREVWEVLRTELGPDDVLMANLRLSDEVKDHEADIVAIIAGAGVVVVEVKGGSVGVVGGQWRQSGNDTRTFDPVDQARTTKYSAVTPFTLTLRLFDPATVRSIRVLVGTT